MRGRWRWRKSRGIGLIVGDESEPGATPFAELAATPISAEARAARAALTPESIGKYLLTSGSTGHPKAVVNTQRMLCASHAMLREALPFFKDEPPVLVEWLPWAHTFGSNSSFGLILYNGGTFYIDEGRPTPAGIATTVKNLREIAPTIFFNVPKGFEELLPYLQSDAALRKTFFSRTRLLFYAGAGLSQPVFDGYRELVGARDRARRCRGRRRSARPRPARAPSSTSAARAGRGWSACRIAASN